MAKHDQYVYLGLRCSCTHPGCESRSMFDMYGTDGWKLAERSEERVLITCEHCGGTAGRFYRLNAVDIAKADSLLPVGTNITAMRSVAWVGYATSKHTIRITYDEQFEEEVKILASLTGNDAEWARQRLHHLQSAQGYRVLLSAFGKQARWNIRKEAYKSRVRGLWLRDWRVMGRIVDTVRCVTGHREAGYYGDEWGDTYEPPYLGGSVYHRLHVVEYPPVGHSHSLRLMVYPPDAEVA